MSPQPPDPRTAAQRREARALMHPQALDTYWAVKHVGEAHRCGVLDQVAARLVEEHSAQALRLAAACQAMATEIRQQLEGRHGS